MAFWISGGALTQSSWNVFLNPFLLPADMNETVWVEIAFENRVMMGAGIVVAVLWGVRNLQKRERFV